MRRQGVDRRTEEPETAYYISSLPPDRRNVDRFAELIRGHWASCEIRNHWVRDHIFGEDKTRSKNRHLNANLAILRVALLAIKAHRLHDRSWPEVVERSQTNRAFSFQLIVNYRIK